MIDSKQQQQQKRPVFVFFVLTLYLIYISSKP